MDFFTVDIWTGHGLTRYAVLFVIDLSTRRVEIAGMVSEPDSADEPGESQSDRCH